MRSTLAHNRDLSFKNRATGAPGRKETEQAVTAISRSGIIPPITLPKWTRRDAATVKDSDKVVAKHREIGNRAKKTVDELQHQVQLMQAIFDSISDGVIVADENGNLTFNPSAERIIGMRLDSMPEQWTDDYRIFYPDTITPIPTEEMPLARAMRGEPTDEMEMFIRTTAKPEGVYISASGRPISSAGTTARGGVIVFRDVTESVQAEEALAQAFAQGRLEVMDTILHNIGNAVNSVAIGIGTLKEQLVSNRLITRLSALSKAVKAHSDDWNEYIRHDPQGQQVRPFLVALADDFVKQNQQLIHTVERVRSQTSHIVDIVRTQRGFDTKAMTCKDVNFRQAILGALRILQDSFARRGIRTHVSCGNAPEEIRIQEVQFNQMLINLLKNAMEAIDELRESGGLKGLPRIEIRAHVRREFLVIDVLDNGIGIPQKNLKAIFRAGYTTKTEGTGLGLHSAANFVSGTGGKIQPLSSGTGTGTTMRVMLRLDTC